MTHAKGPFSPEFKDHPMSSLETGIGLIVAASSGIGRATAIHLAQGGKRAIARNAEALAEWQRLAGPSHIAEFLGRLLDPVSWKEFRSRDYRTDR